MPTQLNMEPVLIAKEAQQQGCGERSQQDCKVGDDGDDDGDDDVDDDDGNDGEEDNDDDGDYDNDKQEEKGKREGRSHNFPKFKEWTHNFF